MGQCCTSSNIKQVKFPKQKNGAGSLIKVLVVGAGESGKSTLVRQLCLLDDMTDSFDQDEIFGTKPFVIVNVVEGAYKLANLATSIDGFEFSSEKVEEAAQEVVVYYTNAIEGKGPQVYPTRIPDDVGNALAVLARDRTFMELLAHSSPLQIPDGWSFLMKRAANFPDWGGKDWQPDSDDLIHTRRRTIGVISNKFHFDGRHFEVVDVGGQVNERKRWQTLFHGVTGLIWMQSLADYDQVLFEDNTTNRLVDALNLFGQTVNYSGFKHSGIIMFLNKEDMLRKKFCEWKIPFNEELGSSTNPVPKYSEDLSHEENIQVVVEWYKAIFTEKFRWTTKDFTVRTLTAVRKNTVKDIVNVVFLNFFYNIFSDVGLVSI